MFPELFAGPLDASILGRARASGAVEVVLHQLRDWAEGPHRQVDDLPYGGGPGMVLKPEPLFRALDAVATEGSWVVALAPVGELLNRDRVVALSERDHLVLLCGRYEGFDQRVLDERVDQEISIGDYVLSGGEFPALVVIDAVARRLPGVLGNDLGVGDDSFESGLLEAPAYTRPAEFQGLQVPEILRSGDHAAIARWRGEQSRERTQSRRPELLAAEMDPELDEKSTEALDSRPKPR